MKTYPAQFKTRDVVSYFVDVKCFSELDAYQMVSANRGMIENFMSDKEIMEMRNFLGY